MPATQFGQVTIAVTVALILAMVYLVAAHTSYQACVTKIEANPGLSGGAAFVDDCNQWNPFPQN